MATIKGVDVSKYQPTNPDPAVSLTGINFYVAKATEGTTVDSTYAAHIAHARASNILIVGAYHFGHNGPVQAQVDAFLNTAGNVDFYALDIEGVGTMTEAQGRAFIAAIQNAGHKIAMYHSDSGFPYWGQDYHWVAKYAATPPVRNWDIWQYGPFAPNVDGDIYNGSLSDMKSRLGVTVVQLPITDKTPKIISTHAPTTWYDLDGSVAQTGHGAITAMYSPYGVGNKRAIYTSLGVSLVIPATVSNVPVPTPDCTAAIAAAITADRAKAKITYG